jgi:Uma2 family endonuclease
MPKAIVKVGLADNGKRLSLEDFDKAEVQEGCFYELGQGVVVVSDVPGPKHFAQVDEIRQQLAEYRAAHRSNIYRIGAAGDCKLLMWNLQSERHPDIVVYRNPPESVDDLWSTWIPDIVVEVVSLSSAVRDYEEKRKEYLRFGVREYWIVDADKQEMLALRRSGNRWRDLVVRPPDKYTTRLLPGFELDLVTVFKAADDVAE